MLTREVCAKPSSTGRGAGRTVCHTPGGCGPVTEKPEFLRKRTQLCHGPPRTYHQPLLPHLVPACTLLCYLLCHRHDLCTLPTTRRGGEGVLRARGSYGRKEGGGLTYSVPIPTIPAPCSDRAGRQHLQRTITSAS